MKDFIKQHIFYMLASLTIALLLFISERLDGVTAGGGTLYLIVWVVFWTGRYKYMERKE